MKSKQCSKCKQSKPISEFFKNKGKKDGLSSRCKKCDSIQQKKRNAKPEIKAQRKKKLRKYYARPEIRIHRAKQRKEYLEKHEVKIRIQKQARKNHLKRTYNITPKKYDQILKTQNNRCAICGKKFVDKICIDHDHKNGTVRGLLCHKCNALLGMSDDSVEILMNAIKYILGKF